MKKYALSLAILSLPMFAASAQDYEIPVSNKTVTNSFWSNWYVSGGVDFMAAYSSEEDLSNKNPFSDKRGTLGFDLALGKWFTPGIGLRTKFEGVWGKQVRTSSVHPLFNYWNIHEDVTFNLSNLIKGYNEKRVWNFIPYMGFGVARNMSANLYDVSYNLGFLNNFRINRHWTVFADLHVMAMDGSFDDAPLDQWGDTKRFSMRHFDKYLGLSVGVTYHIGKSVWKKAVDAEAIMEMNQAEIDAMSSALNDQQMENERLRKLLSEKQEQPVQKEEVEVQTICAADHSIFFYIGKDKYCTRKDLVDLKNIVAFAKQHNKKIEVVGYADSRTGSAEYNQKLSEKRADVVVNDMIKMGFDEANIVKKAMGGVNDITPYSYNRRVIVKVF